MHSPQLERILLEIGTHPKERVGFNKQDCDSLQGEERKQAIEALFSAVQEWSPRCNKPLLWLLGDKYVDTLKSYLQTVSLQSPAYGFLSYFIFEQTQVEADFLACARGLIAAVPPSEMRKLTIVELEKKIGQQYHFKELCCYLVLNDQDSSMRRCALRSLLDVLHIAEDDALVPAHYEKILTCIDRGDRKPAESMLSRLYPFNEQWFSLITKGFL